MIKPDLIELINRHKPIERLNNNNADTNNTNNNNTDNNNNNTDTNTNNNNNNNNNDRGEWKIMLRMYIKCISTKSFDETRTMLSKSKQVEFSMGSDTENVINTLLIHFYKIFNAYKKLFLIPDSVE